MITDKILKTKQELSKFYTENNGNIFISFSGGKDSMVLKHIAQSIYPDIEVVFSNTTNEDSDIVKYVSTFSEVTTVFPKMSFTDVLKKYGFPLISKENAQKVNELKHTKGRRTYAIRKYGYQNHEDSMTSKTNSKGNPVPSKGAGKCPDKWQFIAGEKFDITGKCCDILKKNPLKKWGEDNNKKPVIALMSGESKLREQLALYGKEDDKKSYPMLRSGWSDSDIWEYARIHNIRFAECYYDRVINGIFIEAEKRTGCAFCAFGIQLEKENRLEKQRHRTPKRYAKIMSTKNNGVTYKEALDIILSR